jgi:LPXTG-site transpeptidase (sortase) family protein
MMGKKRLGKLVGIICFVSGALLLSSVTVPILSYEIKSQTEFVDYLSPVPEVDQQSDPNSWLPELTSGDTSEIGYYTLTIPKLGIRQATVAIGGEDLADSLIQFPGTALPGKAGNSVVFGHSVLPAFYNPEVYLSIFSTLPTLKKNDKIYLDYDGIRYEYVVSNSYEVMPTNLEVLSQNKTQPTLSLITCVPPGDPRRPRRLVVEATLTPLRGTR